MIKTNNPSFLARLFSSRVRGEVFSLLFGLQGAPLHLREIQRRSGLSVGTVQRELRQLEDLGLIQRARDGNRVYYDAVRSHPLYEEIRSIVRKTAGLADVLREALEGPGVEWAFVFGSVARGEETAESDIDLMVVGKAGLREIVGRLSGVTEVLGREIAPHTFSRQELFKRKKARDPFVTRVLTAPKMFVLGDEDEFAAVVE
jgi:predicted nucleotidyltransferase